MERKKINNAFYDTLGDKWYEAENHPIALLRAENRTRAPWILKILAEQFPQEKSKVLDIGCGAGFLSNALAEAGHQVTGIDLSSKSLEVAHHYDSTKTVHYQASDACKLDMPDAQFDVACAMDLLEHVEEPQKVIAEAARILKPGGLFFFHTFNRTLLSWLFAVKGIEWFIPNTPPQVHLYRFFIKPSELKGYLRENSLSICEMHGLMPAWNAAFLKLLLRQGISPQLRFKKIDSLSCGYVGFARKTSHPF